MPREVGRRRERRSARGCGAMLRRTRRRSPLPRSRIRRRQRRRALCSGQSSVAIHWSTHDDDRALRVRGDVRGDRTERNARRIETLPETEDEHACVRGRLDQLLHDRSSLHLGLDLEAGLGITSHVRARSTSSTVTAPARDEADSPGPTRGGGGLVVAVGLLLLRAAPGELRIRAGPGMPRIPGTRARPRP